MKTITRLEMSKACRAGVLSSLFAFASAGTSSGQEALALENLEMVFPPSGVCTITFENDPGLQIVTLASTDLNCWGFAGACLEFDEGNYQFVDLGAADLPTQFYQFGVFDPAITLPPQFEQIRNQMGDEQFAQWLLFNFEILGTLQGVAPEEVAERNESSQVQFEELEELLHFWLMDFQNEAGPVLPDLELPIGFEEIRLIWGDYDFGRLLVDNLDQWGNLQGICEPLVIQWEENEPIVFEEFQLEEAVLAQWLEGYLVTLPPLILEGFMEDEKELPPHFEQLRQELGDEAFSEWLHRNRLETGTLRGVSEDTLPPGDSGTRDEHERVEKCLQDWLDQFGNSRPQ